MAHTQDSVLHKWYEHAPHVAENPVAGVGPAPLFTVIPAWLPFPRVSLDVLLLLIYLMDKSSLLQ